ncbi:MAG TPA: AAA domain-containing protein [Kofleriaceae bacterium]|nr:AAA domain-containing protein [Kofleriaceae bacterium]
MARKRIASVFTYLQELHRVRTPPIVQLERYPWRLRLADVPSGETIEWGARLAPLTGAWGASDEFLLRVARPEEAPCPEPPGLIRERLATGWDSPEAPARMRTAPPTVVADESEAYLAASARQDAFERWTTEREVWVRQQAPLALFLRLYDLWAQFERESEKYQLYFGDGMLVWDTAAGEVEHPLLLQRLELRFDPAIPAFTITESEDAPVLYAPMLRHLAVEGRALLQLQQEFSRAACDPLAGEGTDNFLKTLVHGLWPGGSLHADRAAAGAASGPRIYRDPVLYLGRRSQDFAGAIDHYLEGLADEKELPRALLRVVGIDTDEERIDARAGAPAGGDVDLLLTRPANPEQQRVIRRLEETGAVIVQGPPGTGKSHTIANLIGHLLAQNKSILVTSHASKALRVVREQVARPLQSLCVSVLDSDEESAKQLEESITGILNYFSLTTQHDLEREIEQLGAVRRQLVDRCSELTGQLRAAVACEYGSIEVDGERAATTEVVRELVAARGQHDWLPGPLHDAASPLDDEELVELYRLVADVTDEDERGRRLIIPDMSRLPDPDGFAELCNARTRAATPDAVHTNTLWTHAFQRVPELDELMRRIEEAAAIFGGASPWLIECLSDSERGEAAEEPWRELRDLIRDCSARIPPRQAMVLQHGPQVTTDLPLAEGIEVCSQIIAHLATGKKLGALAAMFKPQWQAFIRGCRVDGAPPETAEQFKAVLSLLEIASIRASLSRRWDRQMPRLGAPSAQSLGAEPEKAAQPYADAIGRALGWASDHLRPCELQLVAAGLDWAAVLRLNPAPASPQGPILQLRAIFCDRLPRLIAARRHYVTAERLAANRDTWLTALAAAAERDGDQELVRALTDAILNKARAGYASAWERARRLSDVGPALVRREELLARLEPAAPAWARALREREAEHAGGRVPGAGDASAAWSYRRWAEALAAATAADVDGLQLRVNRETAALQDVTATYVEKLAWKAQFERTGLAEQQALAGWLALHKKIGKGSGKNAARLKEEAKRTLVKCRQAVPVWIMPLSRVVDSFDIASTRFDVVILDEASQCDVIGLACFAMAREVAVVGDHEQVSPYAVGHKIDKIQGLIDELLDDIPNKQLYDGRTSVYDLARQSFGGAIRLLEHFRCVPEIIQFSNLLAYAGEIRPLREASSARVRPPLVLHPVSGGEKIDKVNEEEAHEIAALVTAVCEMPEYDGCTLGVISMVGTEQAVFIDSLLRKHLPVAEYRRRRLLCGNASQFQGDERDVIFLSMVDSPSPGKRLPILRRDDAKKVFNVAASRARDQLWVVHSLDPAADLKPDDLRLKLLSHAAAPRVKPADQPRIGMREPSATEQALVDALRARDYRASLHVPIGDHVVDIVAEGRAGARVAIQCDGGREQTGEQLAAAVERQLTLERLGWRFIRVRASAFPQAPEATVDRVCARLRQLDILPGSEPPRPEPMADLDARVRQRAEQIRRGSRVVLRAISSADAS